MPVPLHQRSAHAALEAVAAHFAARIPVCPDVLGRSYVVHGDRDKHLELRGLMDHFTTLAHDAQRRGRTEAATVYQEAAGLCRARVRLDQCQDED